MTIHYEHILEQGPTIATLGRVMIKGIGQRFGLGAGSSPPTLPGPLYSTVVPPRSPALIRDYLRHVGGDPSAYKGTVPPHLASQWFFPVASRTLAGLDYPLFRMVNGGCRLELDGPLPADVPLRVSARLEAIDDDGRRALLRQRIATGTDEHPELVVAHVTTVVPLATGGAAKKKEKKEPARVPDVAREIAYWRIPANAGLAFAALTGDFNPVHWLAPYARLSGFRSTILHGFATLARAVEGLHRGLFSGDVRRLAWIEARFTRPLVLPAKVGLYVKGERLFVGDGCCGPAYLVATFSTTTKES